ncbi:DUF397 domain-containing protein [Actinomadura atramentaria]|uniref:DUF397 domain-containing protein n=1 Tax=Actinomadura atramentaria TaxID=1990 RepID=UPI0004765FB0|nr:DUF397 domain-containing protein [Actinomadura atramentaria]
MIQWRKASHSNSSGGNCVELGDLSGAVGVRDSKDPALGHLTLRRTQLARLLTHIKHGSLNGH